MNTVLNTTVTMIVTNAAGVDLDYGDVVISASSPARAVTRTTDTNYVGPVGVVVDPAGILNGGVGAVAWGGYVPRINLLAAAAINDRIMLSGTPGIAQVVVSASSPEFATALSAGDSPEALLIPRFPVFSPEIVSPVVGDLLRYDGASWVNVPGDVSVRLVKNGTQAVGVGATVTVAWETEEYDTAAMHDGVNPERITFPVDGKYLIIAGVNYDANAVVSATLRVDGTTEIARNAQGNSGITEGVSVQTIHRFTAGQYIEVRFFGSNNGNIVVANTHFEASLLARSG